MKFVLCIEYNGSMYQGWQKQKNVNSIQEHLEYALSKISNENISVICGSRTDAGVHAYSQIVHFKTTNKNRTHKNWVYGTNYYLPKDINIVWIRKVKNKFNARKSALSRTYRYLIYNNRLRSSIFNKNCLHIKYFLNVKNMNKAGKYLLGENNFTAFRSKYCQSKSPCRNIYNLNVKKKGNYIIIDITANSFLYHMVRNIIGELIKVGNKKKSIYWLAELLNSKKNNLSLSTVNAQGLFLININYPKIFNLPKIKNNFIYFK